MSGQITFATAVKRGQAAIASLNATTNKTSWALGDIARTVKPTYGAQTIQKLADALEMPYKTLLDFRTTAGRYETGQRSDTNSYSVHAIFRGQDDRADLVKDRVWTSAEATAEVNRRKGTVEPTGNEGDESDGNDNQPASVDSRAKLLAKVESCRKALADAEAALAAYDAEHGTSDQPAMHVVQGIPAHPADDNRADCPTCQASAKTAGKLPMVGANGTDPLVSAAQSKLASVKPASGAVKATRTRKVAAKVAA
jgi:hypothetical protein